MSDSFRPHAMPAREENSRRASRAPHVDRDALTVSMAIAPGVFTRNRLFAFFKDPEVRHARTRAALLRGIVRHLAGASGEVDRLVFDRQGRTCTLRYRIQSVRLERSVDLSDIEAACVAFLANKSGVSSLHANADDRAMLDAALRRLTGE